MGLSNKSNCSTSHTKKNWNLKLIEKIKILIAFVASNFNFEMFVTEVATVILTRLLTVPQIAIVPLWAT